MSAANPGPDIVRDDDGSIMVVRCGGRQPIWPRPSPASPRTPGWRGIHTEWFSQEEDCEGQDLPDEGHCYPLVSALLAPAGGGRIMTYPDDCDVLVKYPRSKAEEHGDRSAWP